jgi:hypothetical protein
MTIVQPSAFARASKLGVGDSVVGTGHDELLLEADDAAEELDRGRRVAVAHGRDHGAARWNR